MLLDNKTAIIYGAGGAIGSAVARAYAREGAEVHLAGRTEATLNTVAQRIQSEGGTAHVARVDVLDRAAVEQHTSAVAAACGAIDLCFNATSNDDAQGTPLLDMRFEDFLRPHMTRRGHGVILVMAGGREAIPHLGGSHVAWAALAGLCRQFAAEFGQRGVRVTWLLSPGSPDFDEQHRETGRGEDDATPAPGTEGLLIHHRPSERGLTSPNMSTAAGGFEALAHNLAHKLLHSCL
jgi:3-oxoacyl-[acyl-carrier protein] reductase